MTKKILIFYESHSDPNPEKVISKLIPTFKELGIQTFAIEEPCDKTAAKITEEISDKTDCVINTVKQIDTVIEKGRLEEMDCIIKEFLERGIIKITDSQIQKSIEGKINILEFAKAYCINNVKASKLFLELIEKLQNNEITTICVDLDSEARGKLEKIQGGKEESKTEYRSKFMFNKLLENIQASKSENYGIILLVGTAHSTIGQLLKEKEEEHGLFVKEYFFDTTRQADEANPDVGIHEQKKRVELRELLQDTPNCYFESSEKDFSVEESAQKIASDLGYSGEMDFGAELLGEDATAGSSIDHL